MAGNINRKESKKQVQLSNDQQQYRIDLMLREFGVSRQAIEAAIKAVGNKRKRIEKYLKENKRKIFY